MPAIITHHIFGEDILRSLPQGMVEGDEEALAFLLGNQGPDPYYARSLTFPARAVACHELARSLHAGRVTRTFLCIREGVGYLPRRDERVGRAFALGVLGHYALDRVAHPLVYAQELALADVDESLRGCRRGVHAIVEADIDAWVLAERRQATVAERPVDACLMRTERIGRVGGALLAQAGLAVHAILVGAREYPASVRDYELAYRVIDPYGSLGSRVVGRVQEVLGSLPMARVMAHPTHVPDDCPSANLGRRPWSNPFTGEVRDASMADLYDEAALAYPSLAEAFVRGDAEGLRGLVGGLSFEGRPKTDD